MKNIFIVSILLVLLLGGCVLPIVQKSNETGTVATTPKINSTDLPSVIKELKKSVVLIEYSGSMDQPDVWGDNDFDFIGSGVIYSVDGNDVYVITNRHVVDLNYPEYYSGVNNEEIAVLTQSGDRFVVEQRLVAPQKIDLAILKFKKGIQNISSASVSDGIPEEGSDVIMIGMPEQLNWSISKGIVSGIRTFKPEGTTDGRDYTAIQTDAAINSGNSGGGMFALDGRLLGINTWKYIGSGVEGLNFAISSADFLALKDKFYDLPISGILGGPATPGSGSVYTFGYVDIY